MPKTLPISEVKARLSELVTGIAEREEEVVVTRNGKPAAVLLNYDEYERFKETLDVLSDQRLMKQIQASERYFARGGKGLSFEEVFGEPLHQPGTRARGREGFRYRR
ncbi:MAG TPA: type II toxin-antitoxin system Phd/YefM family antitoxin [Burkholderiales bacterium]